MDERLSFFYRLSGLLGILGALALVGAVVAMTAAGTITRLAMALYLLAAVLLASFLAPRIEELGELLSSRTARQGSTVVAFSVAVIGILVLINVVGDRYSQQLDITVARQFTLSDQTVKVIEQVNQPVRITAFFPADDYTQGAVDLLGRYARQSPHISLEVIDPLRQRAAAEQAGIRSIPVTIFELGERREETLGLSEQDFTSALLKLTRPEQKKVYFLTGHNERDPDGFDQHGYSGVAEALRRENYVVEKLSLVSEREVAADAAVVILAAPRTPLLDFETAALRDYLDGGGALLVVADPQGETDLNRVVEGWGVRLRNDLVVDPGRFVPPDPGSIIPIPEFGHRISSSLPATTVLSLARSLSLDETVDENPPADLEIRSLLKTSDRAWGETNLTEPAVEFNEGEDHQGPLTVAVAINRRDPVPSFAGGQPPPTPTPVLEGVEPERKGRLVVLGDSDFAANGLLRQLPTNLDLVINSVNWLAEEEELISIRATPANVAPVVLNRQQSILVFYITVVFVPVAVMLLGVVVWWQRR